MRANGKLIPLVHSCQIGDFCVQLMPKKILGTKMGKFFWEYFFFGTRNLGNFLGTNMRIFEIFKFFFFLK